MYASILKSEPSPIVDAISGLNKSNILVSALRLGLFECLASAAPKGLTFQELKQKLSLNSSSLLNHSVSHSPSSDVLENTLLSAVSIGLILCDSRKLFFLTPLSKWFLSSFSGFKRYFLNPTLSVNTSLENNNNSQLAKATTTPVSTAVDASSINTWSPLSKASTSDFRVHDSDVRANVFLSGQRRSPNPSTKLNFDQHRDSPGSSVSDIVDSDSTQFLISKYFSSLYSNRAATLFDLSWARKVVEISGNGSIAAVAAALYPDLIATVIGSTSPSVVAASLADKPEISASSRVRYFSGDVLAKTDRYDKLFENGTELFALTGVLYQMDAVQPRELFALAYSTLSAGGAILVSEVAPEMWGGVGGRREGGKGNAMIEQSTEAVNIITFNNECPSSVVFKSCQQTLEEQDQMEGEEEGMYGLNLLFLQSLSESRRVQLRTCFALLKEAGFRNIQVKATGTYLDVVLAW
eukprot:CAMPEP_0175071722 /NCGR_PEP_ID=MMETSP0052_2-20121109/19412_1 /TAXON_ID=51329 ORGANISM="Polytomella parva, Strain SAG 63-3" /NCGR_SAMPLE_ID=MMETSP0052_2 /ASSEMBLY_ACC=CAM_ASM_000194 /LENGTH=465 /DNA_ID=CAMNT_0016338947 /DNA_START=25 /DNA_END=1419 /DNA_ORIENTATION=-